MTQDLRLAFRLLVHQPLMATTAIVALTVGICIVNVGFATVEALLFSHLPFEGGDRFVRLTLTSPLDRVSVALQPESYVRLLSGATTLEHVGAYSSALDSATLPSGLPDELDTTAITVSSLQYIPGAPLRGRPLVTSDGVQIGRAHV